MNFIGLDLAWGSLDLAKRPNRSGIAVLDPGGNLTYVGAQVLDDDIRATVAPYVAGPCVVAIDAPLKITNQTGQRLAENKLGKHFSAFDAGPHSAAIKRFSADPRGARLTRALELDIDPRSTSPRRALEVYPHPASVALFRLGRIFKFKNGTPEERRPELLEYMTAIEGLATSPVPMYATVNDDWNRLRQDVEQAQRQFELDRAEDPIDAVLCAYIALYAKHRPDDVTIYGDYPANGYILTPTLPPGLKPSKKSNKPTAGEPVTTTSVVTKPLSQRIAAEHGRCAGRVAAVNAVWADIDRKVRELDVIPTRDATEADVVVDDSLTQVDDVLEVAQQELSAIRNQLARHATEDADTQDDAVV
jgi:predicted RNase H-like nuclease